MPYLIISLPLVASIIGFFGKNIGEKDGESYQRVRARKRS